MTATAALTTELKRLVLDLEADLRTRIEADSGRRAQWAEEHRSAVERSRTAASWVAWRDDRITQVAVSWVLTTVFLRFCEDNDLVTGVWCTGPGPKRQEALDAQLAYFRSHPLDTDREWIEQGIAHLSALQATRALVDEHAPFRLASISGDAATAVLDFWRRRDDSGALVHDLSDPELSTRFLGDLYQDLSEHAKETYALLQTPEFVEEFILDRTLEPALAERPLEGFRMIDPTCGSGHFLLGAFARLRERWDRHAPALEAQARVQAALDAVHGVDINAFAVAIARFRLVVEALRASGVSSLEKAPAFRVQLVVGDSLLHGVGQQTLSQDVDLSTHAYSYEDVDELQAVLTPGRYDVVVGNPPYIAVKDRGLSEAYRERYPTCKGKYSLIVPFMEQFFNLASTGATSRPVGWVGQITSNAFMKRSFGSKLVEQFLVRKDLRLLADTSGAYIPGHGTPTVIVVGRNQTPHGDTVRAVVGLKGEPGRPSAPENGTVWREIVEHVDSSGYESEWVSVVDVDRVSLASHPWSLSGGAASPLLERFRQAARQTLSASAGRVGYFGITGFDQLALAPFQAFKRLGVEDEYLRMHVAGDEVRDWLLHPKEVAWYPYAGADLLPIEGRGAERFVWPFRELLAARRTFAGTTYRDAGLAYWQWHQLPADRKMHPWVIAWSQISTHNHFALGRSPWAFNSSASILKLPVAATEEDHLALLGLLNSSSACFWLKRHSHNKGSTVDAYGARQTLAPWEDFYEFAGTTLRQFPLPAKLPLRAGRQLDELAKELAHAAPAAVAKRQVPRLNVLEDARERYIGVRGRLIAEQEELDWEVYHLYGLVDDSYLYRGNLPALALGERAFEISLARRILDGEESRAWFDRHGSSPLERIPDHWPTDYRQLVQRRLDLIVSDPSIRLLERPEYKRRWAGESWEKQQAEALRDWLLNRLDHREYWFDRHGRPLPQSVVQLADRVERDVDLVSVLGLWAGRRDVPVAQALTSLLSDEAVPYLAAHRYKDSGLRKRAAWEETWALQRREDAGERLSDSIPVPPRYSNTDFRKPSYWHARGKLDVHKERFIAYPGAGRDTDPTPLLGWAGWDHAQQSLALSIIIGGREEEGWADERLTPLVAGLAELQPWVDQWHAEVDPTYGVSLAAYCASQLSERMAQVGATLDDLAAWRPEPATRGRKPRKATA